jgi:hypothetical protein
VGADGCGVELTANGEPGTSVSAPDEESTENTDTSLLIKSAVASSRPPGLNGGAPDRVNPPSGQLRSRAERPCTTARHA